MFFTILSRFALCFAITTGKTAQKGSAMESSDHLAQRCTDLLEINHDLFGSGHPEAAFHALAAALHCAEDGSDVFLMSRVLDAARDEHHRIVQHLPPTLPWAIAHDAEMTAWASM